MPVITVTLIEGYDTATRRDFAERLTDAARAAIGAQLDGITVVINEVPAENYMRGRTGRTPGTPPPSAISIGRDYLAAMESRDLEGASAYLADGFTMTFPGGAVFARPEELVDWARNRYRSVAKTYEGFDEAESETGSVVYCFGTLHGVWPDGTPFDGIRFVDRFTVSDGMIRDQRVWNDLAEVKAGTITNRSVDSNAIRREGTKPHGNIDCPRSRSHRSEPLVLLSAGINTLIERKPGGADADGIGPQTSGL